MPRRKCRRWRRRRPGWRRSVRHHRSRSMPIPRAPLLAGSAESVPPRGRPAKARHRRARWPRRWARSRTRHTARRSSRSIRPLRPQSWKPVAWCASRNDLRDILDAPPGVPRRRRCTARAAASRQSSRLRVTTCSSSSAAPGCPMTVRTAEVVFRTSPCPAASAASQAASRSVGMRAEPYGCAYRIASIAPLGERTSSPGRRTASRSRSPLTSSVASVASARATK